MKKGLFGLAFVLVTGCTIVNKINHEKRKAIREKFTVSRNTVYYNNNPFAELQAMTWSLENGELVKEMNFKLLNKSNLSLIGDMIDFLSVRHNGDEIEVEFNVDQDSEEFKL